MAAIVAAVLGVVALFASSAPILALLLAVAAIVIALLARRQLKANPRTRGFAVGLIGFLAAIWVIVVTGIPYIYMRILVASVVGSG